MESETREAFIDAKAILSRALEEMTAHARTCLIRDEIFIAPRAEFGTSDQIAEFWSSKPLTRGSTNGAPLACRWIHPNTRRTLADDIGMFLTHHGNVPYDARTRNELFFAAMDAWLVRAGWVLDRPWRKGRLRVRLPFVESEPRASALRATIAFATIASDGLFELDLTDSIGLIRHGIIYVFIACKFFGGSL